MTTVSSGCESEKKMWSQREDDEMSLINTSLHLPSLSRPFKLFTHQRESSSQIQGIYE